MTGDFLITGITPDDGATNPNKSNVDEVMEPMSEFEDGTPATGKNQIFSGIVCW